MVQLGNGFAGPELKRTHHNEAVRDVRMRVSAVQMAEERALLEGYGSARLHGRRSGKRGRRAGASSSGLSKLYLEHRDALRKVFSEPFGWPLDRMEKDIITHWSSKKQFNPKLCKQMLAWYEKGCAARDAHVQGGRMNARMKRSRVPGLKAVVHVKSQDDMRILQCSNTTLLLFLAHNARLPKELQVTPKELATFELGKLCFTLNTKNVVTRLVHGCRYAHQSSSPRRVCRTVSLLNL